MAENMENDGLGELNLAELEEQNFTNTYTEQPPQDDESQDVEQTSESDESAATDENDDGEGSNTPESTSEDQETTAESDSEGEQSDEERASEGKWSEEQLKYFEDKGLKEVPFSESTGTLLKNAQEAERRLTEKSQAFSEFEKELKNAKYTQAAMANVLQTGDIGGLQQLAKDLGGELNIESRTDDDRIREITENYNSVYEELSPSVDTIMKEASKLMNSDGEYTAKEVGAYLNQIASLVDKGLTGLQSKAQSSIGEINQRKSVDDLVSKRLGIKPGKTGSLYDGWKVNAENAFTELRKRDTNADKYIDALKEEVGEGSAYEAAGINMAKMFGHGPNIAKSSYRLGKALSLLKDHESGSLEKSFYEKFKKESDKGLGKTPARGKEVLKTNNKNTDFYNDWLQEEAGITV